MSSEKKPENMQTPLTGLPSEAAQNAAADSINNTASSVAATVGDTVTSGAEENASANAVEEPDVTASDIAAERLMDNTSVKAVGKTDTAGARQIYRSDFSRPA